jgi:hypothetical protein
MVRPPRPDALTFGGLSTVDDPLPVSRTVEGPATETVSQRQEVAAPAPPSTADAAPVAAASAAAAAEPEELLKKLFDPLLRRLKAELRLDRERRGALTDLRH